MDLQAKTEDPSKSRRERRMSLRHAVDEPVSLLLVRDGAMVSGQIMDLSLGGCRIRTQERFLAGMLVRVEVIFRILGAAFRLSGVTQWTDRRHLVAIRFLDVSARKQEQLLQLIDEIKELREREKAAPVALPEVDGPGESATSGA